MQGLIQQQAGHAYARVAAHQQQQAGFSHPSVRPTAVLLLQQRSVQQAFSAASKRQELSHTTRRGQRQQLQSVSSDAAAATGSSSRDGPSEAGRQTYKPASFKELVNDAANSVVSALNAGETRLEVEFPVLPGQDVRYKGSSDAFIDASVQLALAGARKMNAETGKRVHILVPDETEYNRSAKMFRASLELSPGVTMGYLNEGRKGLLGALGSMFSTNDDLPDYDPKEAARKADVFIAINASTVELSDIEKYTNEFIGENRAMILWCLELDTLRSDLGLLGFPPKALQYNFLAKFKPAFYIRQRDYSKTIAVAPFIINYSGILFREYPGPWQCMLRQDNGVYACVAERMDRYNLGDFKEELMRAMGLNEGEDEAAAFLRRGYKTSTWWEDALEEEVSNGWRS